MSTMYTVIKIVNGRETVFGTFTNRSIAFQTYQTAWVSVMLDNYDSGEDANSIAKCRSIAEMNDYTASIIEDDPNGEENPIVVWRESEDIGNPVETETRIWMVWSQLETGETSWRMDKRWRFEILAHDSQSVIAYTQKHPSLAAPAIWQFDEEMGTGSAVGIQDTISGEVRPIYFTAALIPVIGLKINQESE